MVCNNFERIHFVANAELVLPYDLLFIHMFSHVN